MLIGRKSNILSSFPLFYNGIEFTLIYYAIRGIIAIHLYRGGLKVFLFIFFLLSRNE